MQRPADLRSILRYVPRYRDKLFVIALDGRIVADANFRNLLLDVAVLESLRIGVVLVHGAGHQIGLLAEKLGQTPSNLDGAGVTDSATLQLAITAANRVTHEILEGLAIADLRGACSNAVVAHPAGILAGVDYQWTGRVDRIDAGLLRTLMDRRIIPIVAPLGIDGEGQTYRLNSDSVAVEVAAALGAVKLLFVTTAEGIKVHATREGGEPKLIRQMTKEEAEALLKSDADRVSPSIMSKLRHAVEAAGKGVPRIHVLDGRVEEGLLAEVFSGTGVGTLIHANEYQAIRPAEKKDVPALSSLVQKGIDNNELLPRNLAEIETTIDDFFIFEIDRLPAGCVALHYYPEENKAELACLFVHPRYENQGIGARLTNFVVDRARALAASELFCLSTQAFNFFLNKNGFEKSGPEVLPGGRRESWEKSGRRSVILKKRLPATE